jgi:hypothetical protein
MLLHARTQAKTRIVDGPKNPDKTAPTIWLKTTGNKYTPLSVGVTPLTAWK